MSLSRMGIDYSYGEAMTWLIELQRETGSHLSARLRGLEQAASQAEVATVLLGTSYLNVHRDTKRYPEPIHLPAPWPEENSNSDVTAERRVELEAQLARRSAFR